MPWRVERSSRCPVSRPWAVILERDSSVVACHPTQASANQHMRALYANEPAAGGSRTMEVRTAIGVHHTATTDAAWDGPMMTGRCQNSTAALRALDAWVDAEGDPEAKSSYKFPHHMVGTDGNVGAANLRACSAGIAVLNGSRGGADIPAGDTSGVYAHLAAHLRDAGQTPPDLRTYDPKEEGPVYELERRFTPVRVEIRTQTGSDKPVIGGYAAVFNRTSKPLMGYVERVNPSFFNQSRADSWPDVVCRYNHDNNLLLGTTAAGTLRLSVDETGLAYEVDPPQARADVVELVSRGDVGKSSFAFRILPNGDEWGLDERSYPMRTLLKGRLVDVAPCNTPIAAYADTSSGLRTLAEQVGAALEEVRTAAESDELRRFFQRVSDRPMPKPEKPKLFGPAALANLDARRRDPWE